MRAGTKQATLLLIAVLVLTALTWGAPQEADARLPNEAISAELSGDTHHSEGEVELVAREPLSGVPCIAGFAGIYPCQNADLLAFMPLNALVGSTGADLWGWTDPETGKEYVVASHGSSVSFVDISDPTLPVLVGNLPAPVTNALYRDVKVYNNHAYIVGDGVRSIAHGLQIFDLTQLRDATVTPALFETTAHYTGFGDAHNIAINEETGFAYVVGSNRCNAGLYMLDLSNPASPAFAGCFSEDGYTHDTQCTIYRGSDTEHQGREICFNANEDTLTIVDVTDKQNPVMLSRTGYEGAAYSHQGWLTEDHAYFVLGDELDEVVTVADGTIPNTNSYIWDLSDLDAPTHIKTYEGTTAAIDHNLYIRNGFVYEANYTSGLRILDSSDIAQGQLSEVAYFDTHPEDDATNFAGSWSSYIYFASGVIAVNNLEDGLYLVKPNLPAPAFRAGEGTGGGWLQAGSDQKIKFEFAASKQDADTSGSLSLVDQAAGANIDVSNVTFLGNLSGDCGSISAGQLSLELQGTGSFNGAPASFRACFQDTNDPGKGLDRFYLECSEGCSYSTGAHTEDDVIERGNVQVNRGN